MFYCNTTAIMQSVIVLTVVAPLNDGPFVKKENKSMLFYLLDKKFGHAYMYKHIYIYIYDIYVCIYMYLYVCAYITIMCTLRDPETYGPMF